MALKNVCFRVVSQFTYPILFLIIILISIFIKVQYHFKIPVSNDNIFNEDFDPAWIAHMTDLHISEFYPKAVENANKSFRYINKYIKPPFLLITGDITDGYKRPKRPCQSLQIESQFQTYNQLIKTSGVSEYTFETIGNHDVVGIPESLVESNQTNFHKYFHINETSVSTVRERNNVRIISFNPVDFTSGTGLMNLIKKIDSHNLDRLEKVISKNCQNNNNSDVSNSNPLTIVVSHYAYASLYPQRKTTSKADFGELLEKGNIKYFINGHLHPSNPLTLHHKGYLEITGIPSKLNEEFAVFTVDNGHSNYYLINPNNEKPSVVTYPVPSIYENEIPNEYAGQVRILSFSNEASQFKATLENPNIKEKVQCELKFVRNLSNENNRESEVHVPRLFQCTLPNNNFKGKNTLKIEGDLEETIEFNVGESLSVTEKQNVLFNAFGFIVGISLSIVYHLLIFIGMIFGFDHEFFYEYTEHPIFCLLLGPIITGFRMKKLEVWAKILIAIFILGPAFIPIGFFKSGDETGLMIFWGYSFRGDFVWDTFLLGFGTYYFFSVAIAIEEVFIVVLTKWKISYYGDIAIAVILYFVGLYGWYLVGLEICTGFYWVASLPFFIFPILTIIAAVVHRPLKKRRKILEAERERNRNHGIDENLLNAEKGEEEDSKENYNVDKPKKKKNKKKSKKSSKKKKENEEKPNGNVPEPSGDVPEQP